MRIFENCLFVVAFLVFIILISFMIIIDVRNMVNEISCLGNKLGLNH